MTGSCAVPARRVPLRVIMLCAVLLPCVTARPAQAALRTLQTPGTASVSQVVTDSPALRATPPQTNAVYRETDLDRQVEQVASQLRCVVCQGLSIQDSPSSLAQEMRAVVREQLEAGRSPDEVKAYFVDKYGEWVLLRPKASGFNLVIYLLPIALILGGAAFIVMKARSWTRAVPVDPS